MPELFSYAAAYFDIVILFSSDKRLFGDKSYQVAQEYVREQEYYIKSPSACVFNFGSVLDPKLNAATKMAGVPFIRLMNSLSISSADHFRENPLRKWNVRNVLQYF